MTGAMRWGVALLVLGSAGLLRAGAAEAKARLVVGPGETYRRIADALAAAPPGATVVVKPGTYREGTLVVTRPVTLVGEGFPVLDGGGDHELLTVQADDVTVRGLVFQNVQTSYSQDRAALRVADARRCVIEGNRFERTFFGIYLARVDGCRVEGNRLHSVFARETASGNAIHLWQTRSVTIRRNVIEGHRDGIYFEFARQAVVEDNVSRRNFRYGLHFMFSDSCAYRRNTFAQNDAGVAVMYSNHVEMTGNRFENNWGPAAYGLLLKEMRDSRLEGNTFAHNTAGLYTEGSARLQVERNTFADNGWAIRLLASTEDATFLGNTFRSNTFDVTTDTRRATATFVGNFWDRYQGYDLNRDGVGDAPFRPVRLFAFLVEQHEPALLLQRSFFVDLLDAAERLIPMLTPDAFVDRSPALRPPAL